MTPTVAPARAARPAPDRAAPPAPARGHVPALDGLRGAAILAVLVFHFGPYLAHTGPVPAALDNLRKSAWCGVDLFFVLSGFLITGILLDARSAPHYFRNFYARRTLRIFPLYYGVLLGAWAVALALGGTAAAAPPALADRPAWLWAYCTNVAVALKGGWDLSYHGLNVSHFWSLAVEEQFYLVWPVLVLLLRPRAFAAVCALCVGGALALRTALAVGGAAPIALYVLTPCRLDALALGGLLAVAARTGGGLLRLSAAARWVAPLAGLGMLIVFAMGGGQLLGPALPADPPLARAAAFFGATAGYTVTAVCFAAVLALVAAAPAGGLARACNHPLLTFFGKYSYGIYVYHDALNPVFDRWLPGERLIALTHSATAGGLLLMAVKCALAVGIAVLSWHLFEKHFLRLKKFFEPRARRKEAYP